VTDGARDLTADRLAASAGASAGVGGPDGPAGQPAGAAVGGPAGEARDAPAGGPGDLSGQFTVLSSRPVYRGRVMALRLDEVRMPDGHVATREVIEHLGAVAVVALDEAGQVALIRQYRHAVGQHLIELPAGLLDVPGEPAADTARRELFEEAALRAGTWHTLVDIRSAPGTSDEAVRVFLARDLADVPVAERYVGVHEEVDLGVHRVPLDEAVAAALAGRIENGVAVAGLLAAARARAAGWAPLRPADAPWPARPGH
jgi:ADP-ribose pyrophosphatase